MLNSELIFEGCFKGVGSLRKRYEFRVDASQIEATLHSICREFKSNKLSITDFDRAYLQEQLILQFPYLAQCKQDLLSWKPDLLLLSGCLAPPHVEYVVSAIEQGIKTVMIQHGLDCVHSILDSVPIDAVAVWGEHRADRYRDAGQELDIGITGNPNYDHLRQAEQIHSGGKYLLFTTRPHTPQRCSMPSRWCDEGFLILRALIDSFPNLPIIIKPHPADFVDEYRYIIRDLNLENKVQVSGKKVTELFSESAVVISEDSTVAAEAMIAGRPVVLAQFSGVSPTLPVLEYGAAQISYDKDSLYEHVDRALKFDSRELAILRNNQSDFLSYVVGPLDGNSLSRLSEFLDFLAR